MFYWLAKFIFIGPFLRGLWRPWVEGIENVPDDRPAILASNHLSFSDSFFFPVMLRRKVTFLAKSEYFTSPGFKGLLTKLFMSGLGMVPIDRDDSDASHAALQSGLRVLREGKLLGIYPEGTRSPDGRLYRGKTGVARLALESGAVVLPCAMINTDKIQPQGRLLPKLRPRPGVRIGKPLDFSRHDGMAGDRLVERSVTDEIMYELMQLSGQEYVDQYAAKVKNTQSSEHAFAAVDVKQMRERMPHTRAS